MTKVLAFDDTLHPVVSEIKTSSAYYNLPLWQQEKLHYRRSMPISQIVTYN